VSARTDAVDATSVVSVQTAPPAAAVLQDGSELGVTPLEVSMSKGSTLTLLLKKKGFAAHKLELRAEDRTRVVTLRRLGEHSSGNEKGLGHDRPAASISAGSPGSQAARAAHEAATSSPKPGAAAAATHSTSPSSSADQRSPYERF
jgi:hypothetical protein